MMIKRLALVFACIYALYTHGQVITSTDVELIPGIEYEIGGITVSGVENLDHTVVILLSALTVGDKITVPGEKITRAIKNLWKQKLFEDISIYVVEKQGNVIFLEIRLTELPKLSKFYFSGIKKGWKDDLRESLKLTRGNVVTENMIISARSQISKYFHEKGYRNATVSISQTPDSSFANSVILGFKINPGPRVKINEVIFVGNANVPSKTLVKAMKETRAKGVRTLFKASKLRNAEFDADKRALVEKYNELGYRDARVLKDSVYEVGEGLIAVMVWVEEGRKYYFRNITFSGNTKYNTETLRRLLRIEKGDVYDSKLLNQRISMDPSGADISSIYLDNGYLFSQVIPVEVMVQNDSIDIEIRIREGRQATIAKVSIMGNDRTNDHVIYREVRTRPGDLFSKAQIQRTIRELAQLGYFDPQQLNVNPKPDPETGTVDLDYTVSERSTSQLELQGGWGGNFIILTLGLNFNNFSARNIFNGAAWQPLPAGDGQTISIRAQTSGRVFQSYNFSFTEPWLGGKKPQSFTFSAYHNVQNFSGKPKNDPLRQALNITGINIGLGKRLRWPDDYFTLFQGIELRQFNLQGYSSLALGLDPRVYGERLYTKAKNINYKVVLSRNNTDVPIFPTKGSQFTASAEITPPFSLLSGRDYSQATPEERLEWIEYHKWMFSADWFAPLGLKNKLVFRTHASFGFLGNYNNDLGTSPFERYYLGGSGLQNFQIDGREIIPLRGYPDQSLIPGGGTMYNKFLLETRFLISPNPQAQIFMLGFFEAGNNTNDYFRYRPFELKRAAGAGLRIFMPMFGLLGLDLGYGFDNIPGTFGRSGWQTHFIIGQQF